VPLNQNKRISHRWSWDVSTIFEKSWACTFPSMMERSGLVYAQFDNGVARRMVGNHVQREKIRTELSHWKPVSANQKTNGHIDGVRTDQLQDICSFLRLGSDDRHGCSSREASTFAEISGCAPLKPNH
jgi:hypothetical protein